MQCFLHNDSPDEPGARKSRVRIEKPRSDGGVKKYIMQVLSYTLKTINEDKNSKPSAEALYTRALGMRTYMLKKDFVGLWRWLRAAQTPYRLPFELREAWAAAHGLSSMQLDEIMLNKPALAPWQTNDEKFHGEKTTPGDYQRFLNADVSDFKPAWLEDDFWEIEYKTLKDFEFETCDPETGEIDSEAAWEAMHTAWLAAWDGDDSELVKSKTRKTNAYGEPTKTPSAYDKAPIFYNEKTGAVAHRRILKWTKETAKKENNKSFNEYIKTLKKPCAQAQLQLIIQSQGAETRASAGFEVFSAQSNATNTALLTTGTNFNSAAPPPH